MTSAARTDVGTIEDGSPFLAMELLEGENLKAIVNVKANWEPNIDYGYAQARGIHVLSAAPAMAPAVAEFCLGQAINLARGLVAADADFRAGTERYGIAGNGTGDTRWKVPGVLDWSTGIYNPRVDITADTTTLYASDRDVFLFLVDDHNPIEAGRLPDGSPDLYFRGFYCWNSEVGAKTLGMASFYLRAVCQNRNLWGVEDFQEIIIRHSKYAASRFAHEAAPALSRLPPPAASRDARPGSWTAASGFPLSGSVLVCSRSSL